LQTLRLFLTAAALLATIRKEIDLWKKLAADGVIKAEWTSDST
jgi:hypothetical protein